MLGAAMGQWLPWDLGFRWRGMAETLGPAGGWKIPKSPWVKQYFFNGRKSLVVPPWLWTPWYLEDEKSNWALEIFGGYLSFKMFDLSFKQRKFGYLGDLFLSKWTCLFLQGTKMCYNQTHLPYRPYQCNAEHCGTATAASVPENTCSDWAGICLWWLWLV